MNRLGIFGSLKYLMTITFMGCAFSAYGGTGLSNGGKGQWNVGIRASTLGALGEVAYHFNETFALRFQAGAYKHIQKTLKFDGVEYHDVSFRPLSARIYADWYFMKEWWRATVGIGHSWTHIHLRRDMRDLQDARRFLGIVTAKYRYKHNIIPYVGTGLDFPNLWGSKLILSMDAGISFQGEVKTKPKATGPASASPAAMAELKREVNKLLNDNWWIKYFPAISIGLKYPIGG